MHTLLRMSSYAAVVLLIGCGGEPAADTVDADAPDVPAATAPETDLPPAAPGDPATVAATLSEWSIALSRDTVQAGLVSIRVHNAGSMTHRFEIEGNGEEVVTDDLEPGDEVTMSLNLSAGTYEVYCPIDEGGQSHGARGMRTTLHVR
jgi:plastocyanin